MGADGETHAHAEIIDGRTLSGRSRLLLIGESIGVTALIAWIFYESVIAMVLLPVICLLNTRRMKREAGEKFAQQLETEYREMFISLTSALQTGYSVERAFSEAEKTLGMLFGKQSVLRGQLRELNSKVKLRKPVEQAFLEMSERFDSEDLDDFAQIFRAGKRLGGDYAANIRKATARISDRVEVKQAIRTSIAEQQLELKAMSILPMGILAYMKLSAPEFLSPSYGNIVGVATMTGCLFLYAACIVIGRKITDIRV